MNFILYTLIVSIAINLIMFVPAYLFKTDKITDISYAVTFAVVAVSGFLKSEQTTLHKIILLLVLVWSMRLGIFLFIRINRMKRDVRFDGMRDNFFAFLRFWILQGATVYVVMLAASLGMMQLGTKITAITILGIIIFIKGLLIEATADAQKFTFTGKTTNKGKWIDVGIWKISRHPNYLGEMLVWIGMYLVVVSSLSGINILWALLSPMYIISLLLFVSGIPLLEKSADKKWGSSAKYKQYKNEVPVLIPTIRSLKRLG